MPAHDPTGEPLEPTPPAQVSIEQIRRDLCLGPAKCNWDHEHTQPDDERPIETVDPGDVL